MPDLILTTCGTSLLTKGTTEEVRSQLTTMANLTRAELSHEQLDLFDERFREAYEVLAACPLEEARKSSAEIDSLCALAGNQRPRNGRDQHWLLHTATAQGQATAELIKQWLEEAGAVAQMIPLTGMKTDDADVFNRASARLAADLFGDWNLSGYRQRGYRVIFNLTGGFKSTSGFLQAIGMVAADEIVYLFEGADLVRIPALPLNLDHGIMELIREHLPLIRRLARDREQVVQRDQTDDLPPLLIERADDLAALSAWGVLCWEKARQQLYEEQVWPDPSPDLIASDRFLGACSKLTDARRRMQVNERLDDLARWVENPGTNLHRLDVKKLSGNPRPPSTHECDAWADGAAWRIYMHRSADRGIWILDDLGEALH